MNSVAKGWIEGFPRAGWLVALTLASLLANATAQTNETSKIVFLRLQLKGQSVSLIETTVRPGYLKTRRNLDLPDGIHFELSDRAGHPLWHGAIEDPRVRAVEYEDPPRSGKLKRKEFRLSEAGFTVRVPMLADAKRIEFYTLERADSGKDERRKSLGKLPLPTP